MQPDTPQESPPVLSRSEFARKIGRSVSSVKRFEKDGTVTQKRNAAGAIYYTPQDVFNFLNPTEVNHEVS